MATSRMSSRRMGDMKARTYLSQLLPPQHNSPLFGPVRCELSDSVCWSWVMLRMQGMFHPGCGLAVFPWEMKFRRTRPTFCPRWVIWVKPKNYKSRRSFAIDFAGHSICLYRLKRMYLITGFYRTLISDLNAHNFSFDGRMMVGHGAYSPTRQVNRKEKSCNSIKCLGIGTILAC